MVEWWYTEEEEVVNGAVVGLALFLIFGFLGLKGWVASPKIENFEISGFLVNSPRSGHQKMEIFNFLLQ